MAATFGHRRPPSWKSVSAWAKPPENRAGAPGDNFLGVEVFNAGVGSLLHRIEESAIANLRIVQHDAVEVVRDMIAPDSLAGVHVYFSRSVAQEAPPQAPPAAAALRGAAGQLGWRRAATCTAPPTGKTTPSRCWKCWAASRCCATPPTAYAPRPDFRPQTKFETRGLRLGHGVWDLMFKRA